MDSQRNKGSKVENNRITKLFRDGQLKNESFNQFMGELKVQFNNLLGSVNASFIAYERAFEYTKPTNIRRSIRIISQTIREIKRLDNHMFVTLRTLRKTLRRDYNVKIFANKQKRELSGKQSV